MRLLFGDCVLDPERRELSRGGAPVHLEPQVFDLLLHLIRHRDHVVSKDELLAAVWQGRIVSESTLSNRVNAARTAIGDSGERQLLVRTVARRGLRFVAEVRQEEPVPARPAAGRCWYGTTCWASPSVTSRNSSSSTLICRRRSARR